MTEAQLLTPVEAARIIIDAVAPLEAETIPLSEAQGRVAATDVSSPIDVPSWDNSAMDGYAAIGDEVAVGAELSVAATVPAGARDAQPIEPGTCARILTGAPVPPGADTVIRQEDVETIENGRIRIMDDRDRRRNVRLKGEDVHRGAVIARSGFELRAGTLGLLASAAQANVLVHRVPIVALMVSGDEIADLDETDAILAGEKVASSNTYTMSALARSSGAEVRLLGIAKDDPDAIKTRLAGTRGAHLLVTSAGMSVGDHDHLRHILAESAAPNQFWRLRSRPGAPVGFGSWNGVPWVGLPGNPVSTVVTFELFVRPAIRKLRGLVETFRAVQPVRVAEPARTPGRLQHFLRVRLEHRGEVPDAYLTGPQGSGILSSVAAADALLMVAEDRDGIEVGEMLPAIVFSSERYGEAIPY